METIKDRLLQTIDSLATEILEISRWLYENPELPKEEYKAVRYLTDYLQKNGFRIEYNTAGLDTAFLAIFRKFSGGPKIAFLAEYDALPEIGHGCGHNLIAASCVGAAVALSRIIDVPAEIVVCGTPDEEYDGGKIIMAEAGIFKNFDLAMQVHPSSNETYVGGSSTPHQTMVVSYKGKSAHTAANPTEGINALNAVLIAFAGLHALQQNVRPGTRFPATITHGGGAPNAMPAFAQFRVHVTAVEPDYLLEITEKIRNCARAGALATGAEVDIWNGPIYKKILPNPILAEVLGRYLQEQGNRLISPPAASFATDVGNVSWECPTVLAHISLEIPGIPMHSKEFAAATLEKNGQKATLDAVRSMALTALEVIKDGKLLDSIKSNFSSLKLEKRGDIVES